MTQTLRLTLALVATTALAGCVVQETRPLPQLQPTQATTEVPAERLLDVGIRVFDPGVPKKIEEDPELADKLRIYPEIRRAESRYVPTKLAETMEGTGQWGAVRVIPATVEIMDLVVSGRIVESTGAELKLDVTAVDATGRQWLAKTYEGPADTRAYKDGPGRDRDPFQNVYSAIANDLLALREQMSTEQLVAVRRVSQLRFARDFAPVAFKDYLAQDPKSGQYRVVRLPADGDPIVERIDRIRERDDGLVDTVSDGYATFSDRIEDSYRNWRRYTYDEALAEAKLKRQARNRIGLGAIAVAAAVLIPDNCQTQTCARATDAARYGAGAAGVAAIYSGIQKRESAKIHTDALKEISGSFANEAEPLVVDVEGRTLRLTGTAEEQYTEWRKLLQELYAEETGLVGPAPAAAPPPAAAQAAGKTPGAG